MERVFITVERRPAQKGRASAHGDPAPLLPHQQRHDPITYTYLIDTPPSLSFPAVYVPE